MFLAFPDPSLDPVLPESSAPQDQDQKDRGRHHPRGCRGLLPAAEAEKKQGLLLI